MRSVRPFLLAFALCLPAAALVAEPAFAQAAEPLPDTGLLEFLPAGNVVGDGAPIRLYAVAIGPTGAPVTNLQPKVEVSEGAVTGWSHLGNGIYAFDYTPPTVQQRTPVSMSLRARTATAGKVERSVSFDVVPPLAGSMTVTASPEVVVLGTDLASNLTFTLVGPPGQPLDGADVRVNASAGEVKSIKAEPNGVFTARYVPKAVNYPHLALVTAADARQPDHVVGFAVIRVTGKTDFPVTAPAGAQIAMVIGDRTFGPVTAGRDGKASIAIEVPPGVQDATITTTPTSGEAKSETIHLGIPASERIALFPAPEAVSSDHGDTLTVRALVRTPSGDPDPAAKLLFEATRGTVGVPRHVADGVYEVEYAPASEAGPVDLTVRIDGEDGQSDTLYFDLLPALPGHLAVTADPPVLETGATSLAVVASPQTSQGAALPGAKLLFVGGGAKMDGTAEAAPDGTTRARFLTNPAGPIEILVRPDVPASGNPMTHLVLVAGRDRLANDGLSGTPIVVVATDAWGQPVPGVPVSLDVVGADGQITPSVTTDANGTGLVLYTAGRKASVAGVRARSGNFYAAAAVMQVPPDVPPFALPRLGSADQVAIADTWAAATALVRVEHGGDVAMAVAPVPEVPPDAPQPMPQEPEVGPDEPWLRARAGYVVASYAYRQEPVGDGGPLIDQIFAIGGDSGGKNATPMGFEADARAWLPFFPYVGAQAHYRAAYYGVTASIFGDQVAKDALHDLRVGLLGRYFFDIDQTRLHAGARAGLHVNDFIYFSEDTSGPTVQYRYDTLIVPCLALGAEIGADVWRFYGIVGFDHELAYGGSPYGWSGDATIGFDVTKHFTVDLGAETLHRKINLEGAESGIVRGTLTDHLWLARAGVGVAF